MFVVNMQQYPPYPQTQAYHTGYSYSYLPQTYNLPYPPPDHPIYPIPHHNPYPPVHQAQVPPPQPVDHATQQSNKPARAKINKKRTSQANYSRDVLHQNNEVVEPSNPVDEATTQNFMGDMVAPKKSFQGPSNKLKRKSDPIRTSVQQNTPTLIQNTPSGPSQPKQSRVQTLYPPSKQ